ncbi:MAG: arylsulfatase A-like enzyme [Planctomycetota bacterium]|jgi:arylsulfatase A-like enzyme
MKIFLRAAFVGALCGVAVLIADLLVTASTHGHRFEATRESYLLIGAIGLFVVVPSAVVGGILGVLMKDKGLSPIALCPLVFVLAFGGLFLLRDKPRVVPDGISKAIKAGERRDVLWLVIDTLRADALYGTGAMAADQSWDGSAFPMARNLGGLAAKATAFHEAEAPSGWTIPSTAGLLTGQHPATLDAHRGLLPAGSDTMAEVLQAAGWNTIAHIDNTLLDEANGFAAGFDRFIKQSPMDFGWKLKTSHLIPGGLRANFRHRMHISYSGVDQLVDRALGDLESAGDDPLFLYVHAMDVHTPYWTPLEDAALAAAAAGIHAMDGTGRDAARKDANSLSDGQKNAIRAQYNAELAHVDHEFGRLLDRFDELRGLENAIVVVTSDHGEEFWEHGKMGHGLSLWGEVVRVPMIIFAPKDLMPNPVPRTDEPVSLIDVMPTVADLLKLDAGQEGFGFAGRSLVPALRGEALSMRPMHSEQFRLNRTTHRWREGNLVLVDAQLPDNERVQRLFDVQVDPLEAEDLSQERPDELARLQAALAQHLASLKRGGLAAGGAQTNSAGLDALGY